MDEVSCIEFTANYRRYTPEMSGALMRIATALGTIRAARVLPAVADQLRASARVGTIHYSNLIEGNLLPVIEAERAARGDLTPDSRAKIELVNYVEALDVIDQRVDDGQLDLTTSFLLQLHAVLTRGLGRDDDPHFKPHHEGCWRDGRAVIFDHLVGQIVYEAPPPEEVDPRMRGLFAWLGRRLQAGDPSFVLAGVAHYAITDIHPFADGNGRVARLFQVALLMREGALPGRMFSFERYYAEDRDAYYRALRSVRRHTLNMEAWLHYFLEGLAQEYERVASTVEDLGALAPGGGGAPLVLTTTQQRGLTTLRLHGRREFNRRDYEDAAGIGRSRANEDLGALTRHGLLTTRGAGPATRYAFSGPVPGRAGEGRRVGRPRKWTDARIERELRAFLAGRDEWPPPEVFRAAGKGPLYAAATKAGGIARWRRIVGL